MGFVLNFHFHGQCEDALALYAKAFDAKPDILLRYSDADPADQEPVPDQFRNRIYHAEMHLLGQRAFLSDALDDEVCAPGQMLSALIAFENQEDVLRAYKALREGATLIRPIQMTTYSDAFASLIDRFGVRWELMTENPPEYIIRNSGKSDARAVAEVLAHTWGEAYAGILSDEVLTVQTDVERRLEKVEAYIESPGLISLLMERAGAPCGVVGMHPGTYGAIELEAFYLRKSEWGRGAGRYLLEHTLAAARKEGYYKIALWVLRENTRARAFYETCGFVHTGEEMALDMKAADGVSNAVVVRYERNV